MRIGIDAVAILPGKTGGIETYVVELLRELARIAHGHDLIVFAQPGLRDSVDAHGLRFVTVPRASSSQLQAFLAQLSWLPHAAAAERVDVLHHTKNYACGKLGVRQVLTLHDVFPEYFLRTQPHESGIRNYCRTVLMSATARLVDHVITVSESSARDIARVTRVAPSKITVTPLAAKRMPPAGPHPHPDLGSGYFLAVGKAAPYKNFRRLFRAYESVSTHRPLVVAGVPYTARDADSRELLRIAERSRGRIRMLGYVPESGLAALYRSARAFISPSLIEGFGLPPLEAARHAVPVALSNIPVHREVMADAAYPFDPLSEESIAASLRALDADDELCARLSAAGAERAARYTWEAAAARTLRVYEAS